MDSPSTLMWLIQKNKFLILIITPLPLPPSPLPQKEQIFKRKIFFHPFEKTDHLTR